MSGPMSPELQAITNLKHISREECILPGTAVCGGCGGLEALHRITRAAVFVQLQEIG